MLVILYNRTVFKARFPGYNFHDLLPVFIGFENGISEDELKE